MNIYLCFWKNKKIAVQAESSYQAQQKAAAELKVKPNKSYEVSVFLHEKADGSKVIHDAAEL
jgi:hypothetical protein